MYSTANYGRDVLLTPSTQFTGGLALPDINPRGGVFGPQGYGGGVFDGMSGGETEPSSNKLLWGTVALCAVSLAVYLVYFREDGGDFEVRLYRTQSAGRPAKVRTFYTVEAAKQYASDSRRSGWAKAKVSQIGAM